MSNAPSPPVSNAPSPPVSNASSPQVEYTKEVRFAVVMYGGVSLAIYINGIAQELLRWARSTAKHSHRDVALIPSNPSTNATGTGTAPTLSGTERVYRKLSYILSEDGAQRSADPTETLKRAEKQLADNKPLRTRFIVDILSGTSAGGINGIFLAKALANGEDISGLENLWIKEGDMRTLLNDKKSVEGPVELQDPPTSLLNSQRMYFELLKAFDSMEETGAGSAPFVDELDLFVTTTDLSGVTCQSDFLTASFTNDGIATCSVLCIPIKTRAPKPKIETTSRRNSTHFWPMLLAALRRFPQLLSQCACVTPTRF